eukprot:TRINITY_DN41114_c0_g1_i1.p1 TRINITY_DN41114_c0_g1~~TRINITY_DN41114_c0_g1_i1.p1  ORF type:complete len:208 (+),score=4.66 TRINITY_DN41114_c0_g1_i1:409-1032(+)
MLAVYIADEAVGQAKFVVTAICIFVKAEYGIHRFIPIMELQSDVLIGFFVALSPIIFTVLQLTSILRPLPFVSFSAPNTGLLCIYVQGILLKYGPIGINRHTPGIPPTIIYIAMVFCLQIAQFPEYLEYVWTAIAICVVSGYGPYYVWDVGSCSSCVINAITLLTIVASIFAGYFGNLKVSYTLAFYSCILTSDRGVGYELPLLQFI